MSDPLNTYLLNYFHYSVGQRLFEDTCLQLKEFEGTRDEREQIVNETCRLAVYVSDCAEEMEDHTNEAITYLQTLDDRDDDLLNDITMARNTIMEDKKRADAYSKAVTSLRLSGTARKPRKPQVANPFEPLTSEDEDVPIVIIPHREEPGEATEEPVVETVEEPAEEVEEETVETPVEEDEPEPKEDGDGTTEDPIEEGPTETPADDTDEDIEDDDDGEETATAETPVADPPEEESETILEESRRILEEAESETPVATGSPKPKKETAKPKKKFVPFRGRRGA